MPDLVCVGSLQPLGRYDPSELPGESTMSEFLCNEGGCSSALWVARLLTSSFLAVLFLQSGLDKVVDKQGNLDWLTGHFASSPFAGYVPTLLNLVTGVELLAGGFSAFGFIAVLFFGSTGPAFTGALLSGITLLMLFVGQRLAKDYAGAAVLVPYFTLSILALLLFA
jgi:hypothetical protein